MTYERNVVTEKWNDPIRNRVRTNLVEEVSQNIKALKLPKTLNYLGLCAHEWHFEKELAQKNPSYNFNMFGVEQNPEVHSNALHNSKLLTKKIRNANFKICEEPISLQTAFYAFDKLSFDIAFFDYMALWNESKEKEIDFFLKNNTKDNYLLLFTTGILRTHAKVQKKLANYANIKIEPYKELREVYTLGVNSFMKLTGKKLKKVCQPVICMPYRNKSGMPQIIFGFNIKSG